VMLASDLDFDRVLKEDEEGLAILDSLPDRLNDQGVYQRIGAHYVEKGDRLRGLGPDGKPFTPPESTADYERARSLFLREVSILQAHHKEDREKKGAFPSIQGDPQLAPVNDDIKAYLMLSKTDQRLGKWDESLQAARDAREVGPTIAEVHLQVHDVLLAMGRRDEAIAALMEGVLSVSSPLLPGKLAEDCENGPQETQCAVGYVGNVPQINPSCPFVRKQACAVSAEVVRMVRKVRGAEAATRVTSQIAAAYGCDQEQKPGTHDAALP
jgi:hypothetical protein